MEKEFAPIFAKRPHEKAPEFVKCNLSFKRQEMIDWLSTKQDEWINLTMKNSKENKLYIELDTWKKEERIQFQDPKDNQLNF